MDTAIAPDPVTVADRPAQDVAPVQRFGPYDAATTQVVLIPPAEISGGLGDAIDRMVRAAMAKGEPIVFTEPGWQVVTTPRPQPPVQAPSVGRIVHVVGDGGACMAAIVTGPAELGFLPISVFPPHAPASAYEVEAPEGIGWHWPERVG